jgi:beta-glucanase (GH16 family)
MLARLIVLGSVVLLWFLPFALDFPERAVPPPDRTIAFAGPAGAPPDKAVWRSEIGGNGWGNGEVQTYTDDLANAHLDGSGRLVITARRERRTGPDGITRDYTSARLTTEGRVTVEAGSYVEAAITAPTGRGLWPAFWLAGADFAQVGWPASGELDVFEGWGAQPTVAHCAVHLAAIGNPHEHRQFGWGEPGGTSDLGAPLDSRAHRYGVYFDDRVARFYIDQRPTMTVSARDAAAAGAAWPFGRPQHLLLNVAVAGGERTATDFPKSMIVGDVKIWKGGIPF